MSRMIEIDWRPDDRTLRQFGVIALCGFSFLAALAWWELFVFSFGLGEARPIVLLSHLDVVPADPREWSTPPFEGRIDDGYVIGRGALDAKGVAVIQLMALVELSKRDAPLTRDVVWLATPDEETGGVYGAGYLVAHHRELLGGAEFVVSLPQAR